MLIGRVVELGVDAGGKDSTLCADQRAVHVAEDAVGFPAAEQVVDETLAVGEDGQGIRQAEGRHLTWLAGLDARQLGPIVLVVEVAGLLHDLVPGEAETSLESAFEALLHGDLKGVVIRIEPVVKAEDSRKTLNWPACINGRPILIERKVGIVYGSILVVLRFQMRRLCPNVRHPQTGVSNDLPLQSEARVLSVCRHPLAVHTDVFHRRVEWRIRQKIDHRIAIALLAAQIRIVQ